MKTGCLLLSLGFGVGFSILAPAVDFTSHTSGGWRVPVQINPTPPPEDWWMTVWDTPPDVFPGATNTVLINGAHTVSIANTESVAGLSLLGTLNLQDHLFINLATGLVNGATILGGKSVGHFENDGVMAAEGGLHLQDSPFENKAGALFDLRNDHAITAYGGTYGRGAFINYGTLRKSGGSGSAMLCQGNNVGFQNIGGTIEVQSGTLDIGGVRASANGTFNVSNNAVLDLGGSDNPRYNGTYTGSGPGIVTHENPAVTITLGTDGQPVTFNFPSHYFRWRGGVIQASSPLVNADGLTFEGGNEKTLSGSISNLGVIIHTDTGNLHLNEAVVANAPGAVYDFRSDADITAYYTGSGTAQFRNFGVLRKSGGTGVSFLQRFRNFGGTLEVRSGTLALRENGAGASAGAFFAVSNGATVDLTFNEVGHYNGRYSGEGEGLVQLTNGTLAVSGTILAFTNDLFHWQGGVLAGSASNVARVATEGTSIKTLNGDFSNYGIWKHRGSGTFHLNETVFVNQPDALFDIQEDGQMSHYSGGTGRTAFNNRGTFRKSGGAGTFTVVRFHNPGGAVEALKGTLYFSDGYDQSAGSTRLAGGDLSAGGTIAINDGTLSGTGTVSGTVWSSGTVAPGASAGLLRIAGDYHQNGGGTLDIEIGGTTPEAQYDRLAVSGSASLNGALRVSLTNGFVPFFYDSFTLLTRGSGSGSFSNLQLPALPTGLQWRVSTLSTAVVLDVVGSVQFEPRAYSVAENGMSVTVTVTRQAGSTGSVSAAFATSNGSAKAGSDYTPTNGTLSWAEGDMAPKSFALLIADDAIWESNETFTVRLTGPAAGPESSATVTIVENEAPVPPRRINCGGKTTGVWDGDSGCKQGLAVTSNVQIANAQTVPQAVYKTYRRGPTISFKYKAVPNGQYRVSLHFAEHQFQAAGKRLFNVSINGQQVLSNFDVFKKAGGWRRALVRSFPVTITNGKGLSIVGTGVNGSSAILSGIEIVPLLDAKSGKAGPAPDLALTSYCRIVSEFSPLILQLRALTKVWASSQIGYAYSANNVLDRNPDTAWIGAENGAPWSLTLDLGKVTALTRLEILLGEPAWTNWSAVGSTDLNAWIDLAGLTNAPVDIRYLYLCFPADPDQAGPPAVRDIQWEE